MVSILWYRNRRFNRRVDGREVVPTRLVRNEHGIYTISYHNQNTSLRHSQRWGNLYPYKTFFFIAGEFEASIESSWNESNQENFQEEPNAGVSQHDANSLASITSISPAQKLFADSELRSGSEEDKRVADSHEEEVIVRRRSFEMIPTVAGLCTHGRHTEINHSGHKTEFDKNIILRNRDSPMPESNTSSCLDTINDNNSSNSYPFDPSQTSLKSPVLAASPDSDQFSVDGATGVIGYSQEATTESNSRPALNTLPSVLPFMPPPHDSLNQNTFSINLRNTLGIELVNAASSSNSGPLSHYQSTEHVNVPSSSNSGLSSDYQSTEHSGESGEDTISSDGSVSTELGNDNFLHHPDIHSKD